MTTEKDAAWGLLAHGFDRLSESLLIALRTAARWWSVRSQLAEGEIEAEDGESGGAEGVGKGDEEGGVGACSSAVCEDEAVVTGTSLAGTG